MMIFEVMEKGIKFRKVMEMKDSRVTLLSLKIMNLSYLGMQL